MTPQSLLVKDSAEASCVSVASRSLTTIEASVPNVTPLDPGQIKTEPFVMTRERHVLLKSWLLAHVMNESELAHLPKLGLIVSAGNSPVGVAFLRAVEGGQGMIDGFLTDPACHPLIRSQCLDQLILDLLELSKRAGMSGVFGLTQNKRVVKRALRLGFNLMSHKLISKGTLL